MPQDLPDDVWIQVIGCLEIPYLRRRKLCRLSLTSRRMRQLVVPVLFRCLEFELTFAYETPMAILIEANMRAQFLFNSPWLLQHTRVFMFFGDNLDILAHYSALHEDSGDSLSRNDARNLLTVIHDAIFRLIFRMPGLRELHINDVAMTPLGYAAISSRPLLTTFSLQPSRFSDITHITPALPKVLRLRNFDYICSGRIIGDPHPRTDPLLADILDHCILDLEKLATSFILLPSVVARIPLHHTLSLRSLALSQHPIDKDLDIAAFLKLLHVCPQLQRLECYDHIPDVQPTHHLLPLSLPNLSTVSGSPHLLKLVTADMNLVEVVISKRFYIGQQPLTQVLLSSPTHLRVLNVQQVMISWTTRELLTFIQSLAVFQNLESLDMDIEKFSPYQVSWRQVGAEEWHSTIKDLLNQLVWLRLLSIHSNNNYVEVYNIGCPISKQGDPADRGHPSLEHIHVYFLCGTWDWDSQTGWKKKIQKVTDLSLGWSANTPWRYDPWAE